MSEPTLVVLQTVERELVAALERRADVTVLAMLRFAALRDRGLVVLALAGRPDEQALETLSDEQRRTFATALRRAADAVEPLPDVDLDGVADALDAVLSYVDERPHASTVLGGEFERLLELEERLRAL